MKSIQLLAAAVPLVAALAVLSAWHGHLSIGEAAMAFYGAIALVELCYLAVVVIRSTATIADPAAIRPRSPMSDA